MTSLFYISSAVAVISTFMVLTGSNAVHALLYLIVSLLSVALVFFALGAPFAAVLEVIIYAGAIMVLFVFVIMMLNIGPHSVRQEKQWLAARTWTGPAILAAVLLGELIYVLVQKSPISVANVVGPKQVSISLLGPYLICVELASVLLLSGLVGAYHLGRRDQGNKDTGGER